MINRITIKGFRSFVSDTIGFGSLTILTGLNSSGKSSVVQSILLLEKAANKENIYLPGHGQISESQNPFVADGIEITGELSGGKSIKILNDCVEESDIINFPEIIYIAADRFGPETSLAIDSTSKKLGSRGENIFKIIEDNADSVLHEKLIHNKSEGDTFLFNLRAWLNIISPNPNFESFTESKSDSGYSTFNGYRSKNVGFGLSYSLPVITALLLGSLKKDCTVIIENPEAHLHPKGQTEIARLMCLCAEIGVQVVVETHSDHLFDGIRLYVKNNSSSFESKIKTYWLELDDNRNTEVIEVAISSDGRVDFWPSGMFDQFAINSSKLL